MKRVGKFVQNCIYSYAIMCEKSYKPNEFYFVVGFKTLRTLHKYMDNFKRLSELGKIKEHYILCSRDYDGNIIRIYKEVNAA